MTCLNCLKCGKDCGLLLCSFVPLVQKYFVSLWSHLLILGVCSFTVAALLRISVDPSCRKGIPMDSSTTWSHLGFRTPVHFYFIFVPSSSNFIHPGRNAVLLVLFLELIFFSLVIWFAFIAKNSVALACPSLWALSLWALSSVVVIWPLCQLQAVVLRVGPAPGRPQGGASPRLSSGR